MTVTMMISRTQYHQKDWIPRNSLGIIELGYGHYAINVSNLSKYKDEAKTFDSSHVDKKEGYQIESRSQSAMKDTNGHKYITYEFLRKMSKC